MSTVADLTELVQCAAAAEPAVPTLAQERAK